MLTLAIPDPSLVLLLGPSGAGKSTFAQAHFRPTEVLSSDAFRGLVSDDPNDQSCSGDAFEALHFVAGKRLKAGRLTVVDATNVQPESRAPLIALARDHDLFAVAIALNLNDRLCYDRNRARPDRPFGYGVVRGQSASLRRSLRGLWREGVRTVHELTTPEMVNDVVIERESLWTDRRRETGPFDIVGDVHGCYDELVELLERLGYRVDRAAHAAEPPPGRRAVFLGDLVDRGPDSPGVLKLAMAMVAAGTAFCVPGNHDAKLARKLGGRDVRIGAGLALTLAQLDAEPPEFRDKARQFLDDMVSHYVLDGGRLVVAHAGMKAAYQGRASRRVREYALYGEPTGEIDAAGLPVRRPWAAEYRGAAKVVYGHVAATDPQWVNNTLCLDTGCVFGGRLSALRYPELELVSVPARRQYFEPPKPLAPAGVDQHAADDLLDLADLTGTRRVETRYSSTVLVRPGQAAAALELLARFAADPRWLIYVPPTMAPGGTSGLPGTLEHPAEAFAEFRRAGVAEAVCQQKHMGSRAVVVVCQNLDAARTRFGVDTGETGVVLTRTGRRFFPDAALEAALLGRVRDAITAAGWWERFETGWVCLDAELLPWSAKAGALLKEQYAPVATAATHALTAAAAVLASPRAPAGWLDRTRERLTAAERYTIAYGHYCWPVAGVGDLRLAPFHLLASEGAVHADRPHAWHLATLAELAAVDPVVIATPSVAVQIGDVGSEAAATEWWEHLTAAGNEGMVIKPAAFVPPHGAQPAVKVRGREYLRIIYGPEYDRPEHLERLRARGLGAKRGRALREFALGLEGLHRFVAKEPLRRVHECAFGVLALESEPIDTRL